MPEITITLNAGYEKVNPTNPFDFGQPPLYHQQRTYDALKTNELVINTYNTGTGKTRASLLRLFDFVDENVLFVAPTNELIHQHADDIREFVNEHGLNFCVAEVTGQKLREWEVVDAPGYRVRNARKLHELIQNPRDYFPELTRRTPLIIVTNPDLFYLSFYTAYSTLDSANLFRDFLVEFDYVVIDEFHYYNAKQLANFLMFFMLSKAYGYFERGRKICLLSATPDEKVLTYLEKIGLTYALVSPDNEPEESEAYEQIQTLAALELTVHSNKMHDALESQPERVRNLLDYGLDGAIISNSLRTINDIKRALQKAGLREKLGLITGAVSTPERRAATKQFPCVLATPTVDIGYNFTKAGKSRQNIDFVCFDALYGSEFTQRVGRAGRLLGKSDTSHPSVGHAFVQGKLHAQLEPGANYERREFAQIVKDALGEDNRFYHYIQSYAILEAFYPLYEHFKRTSEEHQGRVREIFDTLKEVFAPESDVTFDELAKKLRWHSTYEKVIEAHHQNTHDDFVQQAQEKATWSYLEHQSWLKGKLEEFRSVPPAQLNEVIKGFLKRRTNREQVVEYAKQKFHPIQSLFNFRNSEVGIRCGIYDLGHLFQNTAEHTEYDLFHILEHCEFTVLDRNEYRKRSGDLGNFCEFFVRVRDFKNPPARVQFEYDARGFANREAFERQHCWGPTALKGLRLGLTRNGYVPLEIQDILSERYLTCLLSKMENRSALNSILETKRQVAYPLHVTFTGGRQVEYKLVLGSQAYLIHAELQGKWKKKQRVVNP